MAPGWADLTVIGTRILYRELKTETGVLTPEQERVGSRPVWCRPRQSAVTDAGPAPLAVTRPVGGGRADPSGSFPRDRGEPAGAVPAPRGLVSAGSHRPLGDARPVPVRSRRWRPGAAPTAGGIWRCPVGRRRAAGRVWYRPRCEPGHKGLWAGPSALTGGQAQRCNGTERGFRVTTGRDGRAGHRTVAYSNHPAA